MNPIAEDILMHYGMPRRSGRYPYGSGENPYQHTDDFLGRVAELRKEGFVYTDESGRTWTGDTAIAKSMNMTTGQFRTEVGLASDERRMLNVATAKSLQKDGIGATEIARRMSTSDNQISESTVRSWLNKDSEFRMNQAKETADFIRKQVDKNGMVDVTSGTEKELNISKEKMQQALYILEREGYPIYKGGIPQPTNKGQQTNQKVICKPGTEHKDIYQYDKVHPLNEDNYISRDGGKTFEKKFTYPASMDSSRLKIRYSEEGGLERDGVIELRRGVQDLSLGESRYAQVRILVDGTHYLKGMAVYSDDMPDGVDVIFNTNKTKGTPREKVLKEIKSDPDNPFGSSIKDSEQGGQYWYTDKKTGEKKLGLINKRADEGDWTEWKDALPSQFLSKQSIEMATRQLNLAKADKAAEFEEICSLTNPTIKKHLLNKFADECDSAAVHLKAAALPGQKYHVIIPVNALKDTEVYAPNYKDGTKLALVRYPHGGTFEIPILTVNNKNVTAQNLLGKDVSDAIGITSKVAERLSGADFDGDTVMTIPTHDPYGKVKIASTPQLPGLEGFDPKVRYGTEERGGDYYASDGHKIRVMKNTQTEMGVISNLITDMTLAGAKPEEMAAAVRHSMVVIDAEKHKLDYKQSELDNNISALKKKYQRTVDADGNVKVGGASTLISRAKGQEQVLKRQGSPRVNIKGEPDYDPSRPEGALLYKTADDVSYEVRRLDARTGKMVTETKYRHQQSTKMAETDDAMTLVSEARHPMELVYARYANDMKGMANKARVEAYHTGKIAYNVNAKNAYKEEVGSLMRKLREAQLNAPKERQAIRLTNAEVAAKKAAYLKEHGTKMKPGDEKKLAQQSLNKYREELGSLSRRKRNIEITDKEWEAIQAGAISNTKLIEILNNTDIDKLRERAMPKATKGLTQAQINRIKAMSATYTIEQIAEKMGKSPSTISKYLKGAK